MVEHGWPLPAARAPDPPAKVLDAAQQFEALILSQILRAAREGDGSSAQGLLRRMATDSPNSSSRRSWRDQGGLGLARSDCHRAWNAHQISNAFSASS